MADEIKRVEYYLGTIPHKTGEGARVLAAFRDAGINLIGFLGYTKSARVAEVVIFVGEKAPGVSAAARKAGLALGRKGKGFLLTGEDRIGAVAGSVAKLAEAGINVLSLHAVASGEGRYGAVVTVEPAAMRKAAKVLGVA
ncbi:MAG: hypothetical protein IT158_28775 [Bryobacterales bacterium]|nr:hypothetical protein [Bryobacterales bacterium]